MEKLAEKFSRIALVGRYQTPGIAQTLATITRWLQSRGAEVLIEADCAKSLTQLQDPPQFREVLAGRIGESADLAIVVGGDGTMLGLARDVAGSDIAILGINHGRLGFITDLPLDAWQTALGEILQGQFREEWRGMLDTKVLRQNQTVFSATALNDVVVTRNNTGRMIETQVEVDGHFMYTQRADGLIISTPTGSTAYALSAGGPILHPQLGGIVLVPVAPQSLSNRPIVLPGDSLIRISVTDSADAKVHCDMQLFTDLQDDDLIEVQLRPRGVRFIHPLNHSFFATLRQKLNWHAAPASTH